MNATAPLPLTDAPERIAQLIYVLCQTVTMRCGPQVRTLTQAQVKYICERLWASRKRFLGIVARIRAGKPPKVRARKPRVRKLRAKRVTLAELAREFAASLPRGWQRWAREDRARARAARKAAREAAAAAAMNKPVPLWRALRQHVRGWLCPLAPQVPGLANSAPAQAHYLRGILAEPGMQALLLAHPYVGEALRGVCHALGVEAALLHLVPRAVVDPAPVAAAAATAAAADIASADKIVSPTRPGAGREAAGLTRGSGPAGKRPPASVDPPKPPSRAAPRSGVVIIDYWDLQRR